MKLKTILFGILILLTIFVLIDFYKQNESRKIDQTFTILKMNKSDLDTLKNPENFTKALRKSNEFKANFFTDMTKKILVTKHFDFFDYLKPKKLQKRKLFEILNDSTNFSKVETTLDEVDYVVRFFDSDNKLIMKFWIGLDCKIIDSEPKMTNEKSRHLSEKGVNELKEIFNK